MSICNGVDCHQEIGWIRLITPQGERTLPIDAPNGKMRQEVTLADGRKAMALVLHHSTCPNVKDFKKP